MSSFIKFFIIILFASSMSFFNLTSYADPGNSGNGKGQGKGHSHGKGHDKEHGHGHGKNAHANAANKAHGPKKSAQFTETDKTTITNFFNNNPITATALPPGIAMNLARGKPLPPGIAKRFLPNDLLSQLPARPGFDYLLVGNDAVLVNQSTGVVADILTNVLK